jgi:hypothetical protein
MILLYVAWAGFWQAALDPRLWTEAVHDGSADTDKTSLRKLKEGSHEPPHHGVGIDHHARSEAETPCAQFGNEPNTLLNAVEPLRAALSVSMVPTPRLFRRRSPIASPEA